LNDDPTYLVISIDGADRGRGIIKAAVKLVTARVVDGRIDVPPEIAEGSHVAILASDDERPVEVSLEEERELSQAVADIGAGRYIDGWALLDELKAPRRP
jgi:hypothetical protein